MTPEPGAADSSGRPRIVIVAALARDRTIGKDGGLPWHYPEDLRHFKRVTTGAVIVMGRVTLESIGRTLPGRTNVVLTRNPGDVGERFPGVAAVSSLDDAIQLAREAGVDTLFVIGGAQVYALALPIADELLLTFVPEDGGGDTFVPDWDRGVWTESSRESVERVVVTRQVRS